MKKSICLYALSLFVLGAAVSLAAELSPAGGVFVVIVHPDNPTEVLTREAASRYFLKLQTKWSHGKKVKPVDQRVGDLRAEFSEVVHQRSVTAVKAEWTKRLFAGRATPPPQMSDDEKVVAFVLENEGAIGYVDVDADVDDVKVVRIVE